MNIERGDRFTYLVSMSSKSRGLNLWVEKSLDPQSQSVNVRAAARYSAPARSCEKIAFVGPGRDRRKAFKEQGLEAKKARHGAPYSRPAIFSTPLPRGKFSKECT
jgi:Glycosyl hydrolase 109, C-terminal domain